jgi:pullulanase
MKKIFVTGMIAMMLSACDSSQTSFQFDEMTYSPSETVFKLFAPADAQCLVVVGDDTLQMKQMADTLWIATAKGDHKGQTYQFLVDGQASPGVFAKAVSVNGEKGVVVDLRDSDPEGWTNDKPVRRLPQDIVVYEMHHRDFSINQPLAQHPGKFLALTESWAIEHLKQLGINAIHILPSYDYGSVDETRLNEPQYNWGYDPVNYNVPEGGYSTDPYNPVARIKEFKQCFRDWLHEEKKEYDQYIDETRGDGAQWVHFGHFSPSGKQRLQDLITTDGVNYRLLPRWTKKE